MTREELFGEDGPAGRTEGVAQPELGRVTRDGDPQGAARQGRNAPGPTHVQAAMAVALVAAHNGDRGVAARLPGQPVGEVTWCYTAVLAGSRWLRRQRLESGDEAGIVVPAGQRLTLARAQDLVLTATRSRQLQVWMTVFCGPVHGWWEFAPTWRGQLFAGVVGDTALWSAPRGVPVPVSVRLVGRWLADPWLVEDDVARPLRTAGP